ncbi:MAG: hypothetical protein GY705_23045 [Bacteroidetes bacterium]|nr:hypothetical protein [Bacteroidota bacterium]
MSKPIFLLTCVVILSLCIINQAFCFQIKSRYVTIIFSDKKLLSEFNEELYLGRKLGRMLRKDKIVTIEDEILAKVDLIIEKAEIVLDMFPNGLFITLVLLPDESDVTRVYRSKYGKKVNHIAYYSLSEDTIYISVDDTSLRVLAHEVGHAIVDHFYTERTPYTIHELMAQFTERHITD